MNMKLSYRDKVIFIVAIIIIILAAGFFLFIKPKFEERTIAQSNLAAKKDEWAQIEAKIDTLPQLIADIKAVAADVGEKQELFFSEQDPYINELYIRDALADQDIIWRDVETNYAVTDGIVYYKVPLEHIVAYEGKINTDLYNALPKEVYDAYNEIRITPDEGTPIGAAVMTFTVASESMEVDFGIIDRLAEDNKALILNTIGTSVVAESSTNPENPLKEEEERRTTCTVTVYSVYPLDLEKVLAESDQVAVNAASAE